MEVVGLNVGNTCQTAFCGDLQYITKLLSPDLVGNA